MSACEGNAKLARRPRRRLQFGLRTLMLLVLLCAVFFAWLRHKMNQHAERQRVIARLEDCGGTVHLSDPVGPAWVRKWIGDEYFQDALDVRFWGEDASSVNDDTLDGLNALTELKELSLGDASVSDAGLVHLRGSKDLIVLDLSGCIRLRGPGLVHLKELKELQTVCLGWTNIGDEGLAHLSGLPNIFWLRLEYCPLTDSGMKHLKSLTNLEFLYLSGTALSDQGVACLKELRNLQELDLSATCLTDAGLAHLTGLAKLKRLNLQDTQVTDEGVRALRKTLPNVEVLYESEKEGAAEFRGDIESVKFGERDRLTVLWSKFGDLHAAELEDLHGLVWVELHGCNLTDDGLVHLRNLTNLEELDLGWNHIRGPGLAHLKRLAKLKSLSLKGNPIRDEALLHLKHFVSLEELDLGDTPITDAALEYLKALPQLKRVSFSGTYKSADVSGEAVTKLQEALPQLDVDYHW